MPRRRRHAGWACLIFVVLVSILATSPGAASTTARWVFDGVQAARRQEGLSGLERREVLDRVALDRARRIAALPAGKRLSLNDPIEERLREVGVVWFSRVAQHVDLQRGYASPAAGFLGRWQNYTQAWLTARDPSFDAIGVATATAADGWVALVALFVEDLSPIEDPADLQGLELETIEAINRVRAEHGLQPLAHLPLLSTVARGHSADMARRGYFDHVSPEGKRAADRVEASGLVYERIGENLQMSRAARDPIGKAVSSWMDSPGHRKAILNPRFRQTGVGVAVDDNAQIYFTQLFLTPQRSRAGRK